MKSYVLASALLGLCGACTKSAGTGEAPCTGAACTDSGCAADTDCNAGEFCSPRAVCLAEGTCAQSIDCPPGHACTPQGCQVAGQLCDSAVPAACGEGQRCSAAGSCIDDGWCVDDTDCPPAHACQQFFCAPLTPCNVGCPAGTLCSYSGGCVPANSCATDADCWVSHPGEVCNAEFTCEPGLNCGQFTFPAARNLANNMLILLDRSSSMAGPLDRAKAAIDTVTDEFQSSIDFGLAIFNGDTVAARLIVPAGPGTRDEITTFLGGLYAAGGTPIAGALRTVEGDAAAAGLAEPDRNNNVLLITDGGGDSVDYYVVEALDALRALDPPITTYVLGYQELYGSTGALHCYAIHGGAPRFDTCNDCIWTSGDACFYPANDLNTLVDALSQIIGSQATPCSYTLPDAPPDANRVYAYIDDGGEVNWVDRDATHHQGFDFDAATNTATFFGAACETLRDGIASPLIVYGCRKAG